MADKTPNSFKKKLVQTAASVCAVAAMASPASAASSPHMPDQKAPYKGDYGYDIKTGHLIPAEQAIKQQMSGIVNGRHVIEMDSAQLLQMSLSPNLSPEEKSAEAERKIQEQFLIAVRKSNVPEKTASAAYAATPNATRLVAEASQMLFAYIPLADPDFGILMRAPTDNVAGSALKQELMTKALGRENKDFWKKGRMDRLERLFSFHEMGHAGDKNGLEYYAAVQKGEANPLVSGMESYADEKAVEGYWAAFREKGAIKDLRDIRLLNCLVYPPEYTDRYASAYDIDKRLSEVSGEPGQLSHMQKDRVIEAYGELRKGISKVTGDHPELSGRSAGDGGDFEHLTTALKLGLEEGRFRGDSKILAQDCVHASNRLMSVNDVKPNLGLKKLRAHDPML